MNQEDAKHALRVLRLTPGDTVELICPPNRALADIISIENHDVLLEITRLLPSTEAATRITLYQGLPKADKMELIIQKCVELGVKRIVPVAMKRCVVKLEEKKASSKVSRWQSIAEAAAKQSKRGIIPEIGQVMSFGEAVSESEKCDVRLLPYEMADADAMDKTRAVFSGLKPGQKVSVYIGPEGGFDDSEIEKAKNAGMEIITLGKRILRTETAGMMVMSFIVFATEGRE